MNVRIGEKSVQTAYRIFQEDIKCSAVVLKGTEEIIEIPEDEKDLNKRARIGTWVTFNDTDSLNMVLTEIENDGIRTTNTICIIGTTKEVFEKLKIL